VIIPADNAPHLMLRDDVIAAVERGSFHVYAVRTLDEAIPLLTGLEAGECDASGNYPDGTFNALVEQRLRGFVRGRQDFTREALATDAKRKSDS
jgi:predicted ATP-dependent protease